jgi:hypothetical protein
MDLVIVDLMDWTKKRIKIQLTPTDRREFLYKVMASIRAAVENKIADCRNWFSLKHEI